MVTSNQERYSFPRLSPLLPLALSRLTLVNGDVKESGCPVRWPLLICLCGAAVLPLTPASVFFLILEYCCEFWLKGKKKSTNSNTNKSHSGYNYPKKTNGTKITHFKPVCGLTGVNSCIYINPKSPIVIRLVAKSE